MSQFHKILCIQGAMIEEEEWEEFDIDACLNWLGGVSHEYSIAAFNFTDCVAYRAIEKVEGEETFFILKKSC